MFACNLAALSDQLLMFGDANSTPALQPLLCLEQGILIVWHVAQHWRKACLQTLVHVNKLVASVGWKCLSLRFGKIPKDHVLTCYHTEWNERGKKTKTESKIRKGNCSIEVWCKMLCSEKLPLWKKVNNFVCSGKPRGKKLIFSVKKSFQNTHSGRIRSIRHSQGLWRSLEIDRCWKCKKFDKNNVLYTTTTPHLLSKYEHCPGRRILEHHGIFLEIKETHDLV